jgi:hypothetical protein
MRATTIHRKECGYMSINNISTSNVLYESLLKAANTKTTKDNTYAKFTQPTTVSSAETKQPTQQDIKTLLSRLAGPQPSLTDFLNVDSSATNDLAGLSGSVDSSSILDSTTSDPTSFDPLSSLIQAFSNMDSNSNNNSDSSDSLSSLWSSLGKNLNSTDLSSLLEKAYSQSSQDAQSEIAAGQIINKKN